MSDRAIGERTGVAIPATPSRRPFPRESCTPSPKETRAVPGGEPSVSAAGAQPRRRVGATGNGPDLVGQQVVDRPVQLVSEQRSALLREQTGAESPIVVRLSEAIAQLQLQVERQRHAEGTSLELRLGGWLQIRLVQGRDGLELTFTGDGPATRFVGAELPNLLARLQERGLVVARTQVGRFPKRENAPGSGR